MIRVPCDAADVMRYVARVTEVRRGRVLVLNLWCACPASLRSLVEHAEARERRSVASGNAPWTGRLVNDPASGEADLFASVAAEFGVATFRGTVARAGAAVEVVTFKHHGADRLIVAPLTKASPKVPTQGRR